MLFMNHSRYKLFHHPNKSFSPAFQYKFIQIIGNGHCKRGPQNK